MRRWWKEFWFPTVVVMLGSWVGASALEARAYNRATGANVSTVDAMFIQLRVMAPTHKAAV